MQVSIANTSDLERVLTVTVPSAEFSSAYDNVINKIVKSAKVDGFRKGHVPRQIVLKMYGGQAFYEAVQNVIDKNLPSAVEESKLKLLQNFEIDIKKSELGQDFVFDIHAEEFPAVNLVDFSTLEIEKTSCDITDADVDAIIEKIRVQSGTYTPAEDDYQIGANDKLKIKLTITQEGKDPEVRDNAVVVLPQAPKVVVEKYLGRKAGEHFEFTDEVNQGDQKIVRNFAVDILEIQKMNLPELNEAFFKNIGSKDQTLESFKSEVRANLERERNFLLRSKNSNAVVDALLKAHEFPMPGKYIDKSVADIIAGMKKEANKDASNFDSDASKQYYKDMLTRNFKIQFIREAIIDQNKLEVTDEQLENQVKEIASAYEDSAEVVKYYLSNPNVRAQVTEKCLEQLVSDFVLGKAKVKDVALDFNALTAQSTVR